MSETMARPAGLRLTLRQGMIGVAYLAVLSAWVAPLAGGPGEEAGYAAARVVLLASPWVLGGLVLLFDRPGPARNWAVACLLFSFWPLAAVAVALGAAVDGLTSGGPPRPGPLAAFSALTAAATAAFYLRMRPAACPTCGARTLIPLVRLTGQSRRAEATRWCAGCRGLFWRDRSGAWRVERRTTWASPSPDPDPDLAAVFADEA